MRVLRSICWRVAALGLAMFNVTACDALGDQVAAGVRTVAHFRVTNEVVNRNLEPFTATIPGIGNSLIGENGGFEPFIYRNKYSALEDSPNRVVVAPALLSHFDTLREGFLDGADVRIYRLKDGKINLVREDRIPEGGFHVSGWMPIIEGQRILAPSTSSFGFRWDAYNNPHARYYFTVRAVYRNGDLSPAAAAIDFERPKNPGKGDIPAVYAEFKPPRQTRGSSPLPAPKGLHGSVREDGALIIEWEPIKSQELAGYLVYRSDYPPERQAGFYFRLTETPNSAGQRIRVGDMVVVSKKFYSASRNRHLSNRVWGAESEYGMLLPGPAAFFPDESFGKTWDLVSHAPDTPVESPGETCLKLTLAPGIKEDIGLYNHSGTAQSWYPVLERRAYKVEAWLRQEGPGTVKFKFDGFYAQKPNIIEPVEFKVGPQWRRYVATFTPSAIQDNADPGRMSLEFTGPGTFYVDNFRVYRADADYLDFLPEQYDDLKKSGFGALRTHGLVKTKFRTYDMAQLTNDGGAISSTWKSNSLPQLLRVIRKTGMRPWLQIELHMHPQEWLGFVEYMAATYDPAVDSPSDKPWAYKRYAQGHARPWVEDFDQILFELSNETWNGIFAPWLFDEMTDAANGRTYTRGQVYGLFQEHVITTMRSSLYWQHARLDDKFAFVLGGWGGQSYGRDAAAMSTASRYLTIGSYNGGWDEGEGPPKLNDASLFNVLAQVNQSAIPVADGLFRELGELNSRRRNPLRLGTYEAGPGYALNGLNNARVTEAQSREQEQVMKSLAAGTATLDSFLSRAYRGFDLQNFFGFTNGSLWASHAPWFRGGQPYPSWQLLSLFNNQAGGDLLRTEASSVPTAHLKPFERRKGVANAPLVALYATRKAGRYAVVVISRKVPNYPLVDDDGFTPVTVDLPFAAARNVTLFRMTGNPRANNLLSAQNVKIEKIELGEGLKGRLVVDAASGADARGLPPASTFVYVFEDVVTKTAN